MPVADFRDKVPVTLAGRDFVVRVVPMARVRQLADVLFEGVQELQDTDLPSDQAAVSAVVEKLLQFPHRLLSLFVPGLPADIFADEENGVTLPEFWHALEVALTINRVDALKNVFSRLAPLMSQASTSQRMSS